MLVGAQGRWNPNSINSISERQRGQVHIKPERSPSSAEALVQPGSVRFRRGECQAARGRLAGCGGRPGSVPVFHYGRRWEWWGGGGKSLRWFQHKQLRPAVRIGDFCQYPAPWVLNKQPGPSLRLLLKSNPPAWASLQGAGSSGKSLLPPHRQTSLSPVDSPHAVLFLQFSRSHSHSMGGLLFLLHLPISLT